MSSMRVSCGSSVPALLLVLAWGPGQLSGCTKSPYPSSHSPTSVHFIATATADTASAGPGSVRYLVAPGHFGPAVSGTFFGQLVELDRVGGPSAGELMGYSHALLVPWDYGSDCTPTPWARSARWVAPGNRGLFSATLRPRQEWPNDIPTFDLHAPQYQPYPYVGRSDTRPTTDEIWSLESLFELFEVLPVVLDSRELSEDDVEPLLEWAQRNPERARAYPATEILSQLLFGVQHAKILRIEPAAGGTYGFDVTLHGGETVSGFLRTRQFATSGWRSQRAATPRNPLEYPPYDGYTVSAIVRGDVQDLPNESYPAFMEGYLYLVDPTELSPDGSLEWAGAIELRLFARGFPDDPGLQEAARLWQDRFSVLSRANEPMEMPIAFVLEPNGRATLAGDVVIAGGAVVQIRGERISTTTVGSPTPPR